MSKLLLSASIGLALAAVAAPSAEARVDHGGPFISTYGDADGARAGSARNYKARGSGRYARVTAGSRQYAGQRRGGSATRSAGVRGRAVTAGHGGGGTSRSCLQGQALALLNRIESQFGPVQIVSTCRPGAVIAGSGKPSKHRYGLAIDFNAGNRKGAIVQWLIANHHSGGTMTYSGMSHIHVDIGSRFVALNSGGGRARRAASLRASAPQG